MSHLYNKDTNHDQIKQDYIDAHFSVFDAASIGSGFPDLIVGGYHQKLEMPYNALVEVKTEDGELSSGQRDFHEWWKGPIFTVRNRREALAVFGIEVD